MNYISNNLTPEIKKIISGNDFEYFKNQGSRSYVFHSGPVIKKMISARHEDEAQNEINAMIDLQGIKSVPVLYAYDKDHKILIMEKVKGLNLMAYCKNNSTPIEKYRSLLKDEMYQMLERGWIYTDVKIEHILITNEGTLKIIDYGMVEKPVINHPDGMKLAKSMIDSSVDGLIDMYRSIL